MINTEQLEFRITPFQWLRGLGCAFLLLVFFPLQASADVSEEISAHISRADAALQERNYQLAATEYRNAAQLSDDPSVARKATQVAYSYEFNEGALRAAERWVDLDEDSDEALLYVAQLHLRLGEIRKSRRTFEVLLKRGDEPVDERLLALIPFLSEENPDNAYALMRQLGRKYRKSAAANYAVAVMALQAGESDEARELALIAIELDPDWIKPHLLYARALLISGDEEAAIDYSARLVGDDPDPDPEARLELAIMLLSAGRDDDALSQVNQILLEQPGRTDALRMMAIINFRLERLDAARADFHDLLASGQYTMDALYYLGRIADRGSEHEEAVQFYSRVIHGNNAVMSQRRAAGIIAEQGSAEEALAHLEKFARVNPGYAVEMMQAKAQLLASLERYPEALELYDQLVVYRPDSEGVQLSRAELLLRMGRLDDSIAQYKASLKRWPESAMTLNAYGYTLADRTDRFKEAARYIKKALAIEPDSAAIIDSWGWVLYRLGDYDEALEALQKAYERLNDAEVAGHIIEVLWALERHAEASAVLVDAEERFPENELLKSVRERFLSKAD